MTDITIQEHIDWLRKMFGVKSVGEDVGNGQQRTVYDYAEAAEYIDAIEAHIAEQDHAINKQREVIKRLMKVRDMLKAKIISLESELEECMQREQ